MLLKSILASARIMENGKLLIKPALTDIEQKYYPEIGANLKDLTLMV